MWRVPGEHPVVKIASRTGVSAPPAPSAEGECHRSYHADYGDEAYYRVEIPYNKVYYQYPIQWETLSGEGTEKRSVCHVFFVLSAKLLIPFHICKFMPRACMV